MSDQNLGSPNSSSPSNPLADSHPQAIELNQASALSSNQAPSLPPGLTPGGIAGLEQLVKSQPNMIAIQLILDIQDPVLPVEPSWGLTAGALPLQVKERVEQDILCPHCNHGLDEQSIYFNIDDGKHYHKSCRGEFLPPQLNPEDQAMLDQFKASWGIKEGLYICDNSQPIPKLVRTNKPSVLVCKGLITEALAKSVEERIHRRTRKPNHNVHEKRPEPVIKKAADNDPNQTARGHMSLRGSRKASQDAKKKRHPERFTEAVEFIRNSYNKSVDIIIEQASKLTNPLSTLDLLSALPTDKLNKEWIQKARDTIATVMEGRDFEAGKYLAKLGNSISEGQARSKAIKTLTEIKQHFPNAWIECIDDAKSKSKRFTVVASRGSRYELARTKGSVQAI